jgi:DNA (cytosine-5)-methyltransferase 1
MRAIDLYSGIGGWSVGFGMSGIQIVAAYEINAAAVATNRANSSHPCIQTDLLKLDLATLPRDIELVVGSPPCTQFSLSNRGGNGDIRSGLAHIERFLEIVDYLKPTYWVFENVPRIINIMQENLASNGTLRRFKHLNPNFMIIHAERFGTPQRRRRALVGNIDFASLRELETDVRISLGDVVACLNPLDGMVRDPVYGGSYQETVVTELDREAPLDQEEHRINRSLKKCHRIYNKMSFPDSLASPARTLTATCTRVSRESIVIPSCHDAGMRRLTIRERASIQGFPITFNLAAKTYSGKIRQIGNAIPPTISRAIASVILGEPLTNVVQTCKPVSFTDIPEHWHETTPIRNRVFPDKRTFKYAVEGLNFGSGVRFELCNTFNENLDRAPNWSFHFWIGSSHNYSEVPLTADSLRSTVRAIKQTELKLDFEYINRATKLGSEIDGHSVQRVWSHKSDGGFHPFLIMDLIAEYAAEISRRFKKEAELSALLTKKILAENCQHSAALASKKLTINAPMILGGILVCSAYNSAAQIHHTGKKTAIRDNLTADAPSSFVDRLIEFS